MWKNINNIITFEQFCSNVIILLISFIMHIYNIIIHTDIILKLPAYYKYQIILNLYTYFVKDYNIIEIFL